MSPNLQTDGEMQVVAEIVTIIWQSKAPGSIIAGYAYLMVFPDLQAGSIVCKLVERLFGAKAVGLMLQGMATPVNDLSRGCPVDDIEKKICS